MGSRPENSSRDDESNDDGVTGAVAAAIGVAALAAWGISKWFGSNEPEPKRQEKMTSSSSSSFTVRDQNRNGNNITYGQQEDKWTRPKQGWFKLNTDASARKQPGDQTGPATAGGVIRDDAGQWIVGFTANLGVLDSTRAELEAVREGLILALKRGFRRLEVETDSEAAVILIKKLDLKNSHPLSGVAEDCRELLRKLGTEIGHVKREGNNLANALAKVRIPQNKRLVVWDEFPEVLR